MLPKKQNKNVVKLVKLPRGNSLTKHSVLICHLRGHLAKFSATFVAAASLGITFASEASCPTFYSCLVCEGSLIEIMLNIGQQCSANISNV